MIYLTNSWQVAKQSGDVGHDHMATIIEGTGQDPPKPFDQTTASDVVKTPDRYLVLLAVNLVGLRRQVKMRK